MVACCRWKTRTICGRAWVDDAKGRLSSARKLRLKSMVVVSARNWVRTGREGGCLPGSLVQRGGSRDGHQAPAWSASSMASVAASSSAAAASKADRAWAWAVRCSSSPSEYTVKISAAWSSVVFSSGSLGVSLL